MEYTIVTKQHGTVVFVLDEGSARVKGDIICKGGKFVGKPIVFDGTEADFRRKCDLWWRSRLRLYKSC